VALPEAAVMSAPGDPIEVRDELIDRLQALLAHYRTGSKPPGRLLDRIGELRTEHEKLKQADR
jgi:hypothetical protein